MTRPRPYNPEDPLQPMFSGRESLRQYMGSCVSLPVAAGKNKSPGAQKRLTQLVELLSRAAVTMLPDAAEYHFPWEVNLASVPEGKTLRTFGRLHSYDLVSSKAILTAPHNSVQHLICICTKFVEPFQAQLGSTYIVLGETELGNDEMVLKARVLTCVEGINLPLLEKAIEEQRKYFQEREKQQDRGNS